jgi:hypothetical protein
VRCAALCFFISAAFIFWPVLRVIWHLPTDGIARTVGLRRGHWDQVLSRLAGFGSVHGIFNALQVLATN